MAFTSAHTSAPPLPSERAERRGTAPTYQMLSVCHVLAGVDWAGADVQAATLIKSLVCLPDLSVKAIVLTDGRIARELRACGVEVHVFGSGGAGLVRAVKDCRRFLRQNLVRVLHSHGYRENVLALLLSRVSGVRCLVRTEHGHPEPYSLLKAPKHWCALALDRTAARYATNRIIGVSSDLAAYWNRITDPAKVVTVRNAVDLREVRSGLSVAQAKERLGIPASAVVFGTAARLEQVKRLDLFVSTALHITAQLPDAMFVIAGVGRQESAIRQMIVDSGLGARVLMLGGRDDIFDVVRAMDILLITSDHEGIPMVLLEAMALGVAVVSRNVGGIPEVVVDRQTGILVDSAEPIALAKACVNVVRDAKLRSTLVCAAAELVRTTYSAERNAEEIRAVYRSSLAA